MEAIKDGEKTIAARGTAYQSRSGYQDAVNQQSSMEKLTNKISNVDERLYCIEDDKHKREFALWQVAIPTVISFVVAYLLGRLV